MAHTALALPRFILLKVINREKHAHSFIAYHDEVDKVKGSVAVESEIGVFNPMAKIEVEKAKFDSKYIHLRFRHNNKYWSRKAKMYSKYPDQLFNHNNNYLSRNNADDDYIVAVSTKPVEDTSDPSYTLFEANDTGDSARGFQLTHVQSRFLVEIQGPHLRAMLVSKENTSNNDNNRLSFLDSETIVKLPKHLALKSHNGKFLQGVNDNNSSLAFTSDDPNDHGSGHEIELLPSGQVRIRSDHFGRFWMLCRDILIWAVSVKKEVIVPQTLFWPVKIDDNTIALRCGEANGKFCFNDNDYLNAVAEKITKQARFEFQELVSVRLVVIRAKLILLVHGSKSFQLT